MLITILAAIGGVALFMLIVGTIGVWYEDRKAAAKQRELRNEQITEFFSQARISPITEEVYSQKTLVERYEECHNSLRALEKRLEVLEYVAPPKKSRK